MKTLISSTLIAFAALGALPAHAADDHAGHHVAKQSATAAEMKMVDAQVKKVDKAAGKVTLAHGPLSNLDMPAMTMAFRVKDAGWLERMKAGDKIRFMADNINGALTVVHFETAK